MNKRCYYEVLEVTKSADDEEIKKAYRRVAMRCHPDKNPGDKKAEEEFKEAAEAYQVLSDPQKRQMYDRYGHEAIKGNQGFAGFEDIFSSFGSVFGDIFGTGRDRGNRSGKDLRYELNISFTEAVFGTEKKIEFERLKECSTCHGSGIKKGTSPEKCPYCGGTGYISQSAGFFSVRSTCRRCGGGGVLIKNPCDNCNGTGKEREKRKIKITIPAGVESGSRMLLRGEGEGGIGAAPAGDLHVFIFHEQHEIYERRHEHLFARLPISFTQAALGDTITVTTLEGEEKIKIPAGTQNGEVFRLDARGVKRLNSFGRGDIYLEVIVEVPKKLTEYQKKLLRDFAKEERPRS
ncbi:MAG: molecular chaperone DnaJ [Deltaproteobacteria bacterium]|nr:molecular chaperone DnaJ [Deltaproteobacteria bacterium]